MPIFDQGYQHWQGQLSGHARRWLTITWHGVRAQFKNRWTRLAVFISLSPALILASVLVLWGLLEQQSELIRPLLNILRLPPEMTSGPQAFRTAVWTLSYYYFFEVETFLAMIVVLLVGPNLISQDLRFNAIPLYFSRPLRRFDYFAGKLGVIAFYLVAVAILPAVIAYVLGVGFSLDAKVIPDTHRILFAGVGYGLLIVLSAGTLMLALSSLSRNSRYVSGFWIGVWFISSILAGVISEVRSEAAVPPPRVFVQVSGSPRADKSGPGRAGPGQPKAVRQDFQDWRLARAEFASRDWSPLFSYTKNLNRVGRVLLDTDTAWDKIGQLIPQPQRDFIVAEQKGPQFPWVWSAGVLAGLAGISLWILTSRVKSLDRLK